MKNLNCPDCGGKLLYKEERFETEAFEEKYVCANCGEPFYKRFNFVQWERSNGQAIGLPELRGD